MRPSSIPVSVLLLDDGELDAVDEILRRLGADVVRLTASDIAGRIPQPRDLLVTSSKRTFAMPTFEVAEGADSPTWVSVTNQDFLPLRERVRELGVHFLVHSAVNVETLRLFLLQMLYTGSERRASRRLPLGVEVILRVGALEKIVRLLEVSAESCRILSSEPLRFDSRVTLALPEVLSGGDRCELRGTPVRSSACQTRTGEIAYATVLRYEELGVAARVALDGMARGEQIGTPVTPLVAVPKANGVESEPDRRNTPRHAYDQRVQLLELCDSNADSPGLGRDLSLDGIRVDGYRELESGARVTLALYAGRREEPLVVAASVVRRTGADQLALRFEKLNAQQKRGIEKLVIGSERLASLDSAGPIVMTKLVARA